MILTVVVTMLVEGIVVAGYGTWRKKPLGPLLATSMIANLITQSMLWMVLSLFFQYYLFSLLIAEACIWMLESFMLYGISANQLRLKEAVFLSLAMNLASFSVGWFLPI